MTQQSTSISRREALIGLVALFGGGVLAAPSVAAASTGAMQFGAINNAGSASTSLASTSPGGGTLYLENSGSGSGACALIAATSGAGNPAEVIRAWNYGSGSGIDAQVLASANSAPAVLGSTVGTGHGIEGLIQNAANSSAGVHGSTVGAGPAVLAETTGTGPAIEGLVTDSDSIAPAFTAFNGGHGYGLQVNAMNNAQIRMVPSTTTGPPTIGEHHLGDLFMDAAGVLYRCATSGTPGTWVPVGSYVPVVATTQPGSPALSVHGVAAFSRAGRSSIGKGKTSATVAVPSGISSSSLVLVTLQNAPGGVVLSYAARTDGTHFKAVLNKKATGTTYFSWFVVG